MFGSKVDDAANDKIVTLISSDVTIEGSVLATHAIRVDGIVNGAVRTKESVIVGSKAVVRGGIKASNLMSAGDVYGDVECPKGKVEISDTGRVFGDITAERLVIDENAVFQGKCMMTGKGAKPAGEPVVVPENLGTATADAADNKAAETADSKAAETTDSNATETADEKTEVLNAESGFEETSGYTTEDRSESSDSEEKKDGDDKSEDSEKTEVLSDPDKDDTEGKKHKKFGKH